MGVSGYDLDIQLCLCETWDLDTKIINHRDGTIALMMESKITSIIHRNKHNLDQPVQIWLVRIHCRKTQRMMSWSLKADSKMRHDTIVETYQRMSRETTRQWHLRRDVVWDGQNKIENIHRLTPNISRTMTSGSFSEDITVYNCKKWNVHLYPG